MSPKLKIHASNSLKTMNNEELKRALIKTVNSSNKYKNHFIEIILEIAENRFGISYAGYLDFTFNKLEIL